MYSLPVWKMCVIIHGTVFPRTISFFVAKMSILYYFSVRVYPQRRVYKHIILNIVRPQYTIHLARHRRQWRIFIYRRRGDSDII